MGSAGYSDMNAFRDHLLPGERIAWQGQPAGGLLLMGRDAILVPFSLAWCGFAVFWTFSVITSGAPIGFVLWGMMFVAVGLFLVFGRFVLDAWLRRTTWYAVTDSRVLILRHGLFRRFVASRLDSLPSVELASGRNGRGTLRFGTATLAQGRSVGSLVPSLDPLPQFIAINEAGKVFDLVQRSQR